MRAYICVVELLCAHIHYVPAYQDGCGYGVGISESACTHLLLHTTALPYSQLHVPAL